MKPIETLAYTDDNGSITGYTYENALGKQAYIEDVRSSRPGGGSQLLKIATVFFRQKAAKTIFVDIVPDNFATIL